MMVLCIKMCSFHVLLLLWCVGRSMQFTSLVNKLVHEMPVEMMEMKLESRNMIFLDEDHIFRLSVASPVLNASIATTPFTLWSNLKLSRPRHQVSDFLGQVADRIISFPDFNDREIRIIPTSEMLEEYDNKILFSSTPGLVLMKAPPSNYAEHVFDELSHIEDYHLPLNCHIEITTRMTGSIAEKKNWTETEILTLVHGFFHDQNRFMRVHGTYHTDSHPLSFLSLDSTYDPQASSVFVWNDFGFSSGRNSLLQHYTAKLHDQYVESVTNIFEHLLCVAEENEFTRIALILGKIIEAHTTLLASHPRIYFEHMAQMIEKEIVRNADLPEVKTFLSQGKLGFFIPAVMNKIAQVEANQRVLFDRITQLEARNTQLEVKVAQLEVKVAQLEVKVAQLEVMVDDLLVKFGVLMKSWNVTRV